jgi:DNA-binding protein HU-beta
MPREENFKVALPKWRQSELVEELADRTGLAKSDVRKVLDALEETVMTALKNCERIPVAGLVQLEPKIKAARKSRMGRNPRTGEEVKISSKPASVQIKARVLKKTKTATPSVRKLKKELEAA